jgi:tRNA pseudouridine38-40 synthase
MNNIKLTIQFDGTKYKGWQKQNQKGSTVVTIQGKLENVLSKMTGEEIEVIGCGRTDSGVHADNYVANFNTHTNLSLDEIKKYLLEYLPEDIVIKDIKIAQERFHSRYNAISKTYIYRINNKKYVDVFNKRFTYHVPEELNIAKMQEAAKYLIGTHDFKSFTNLKVKNNRSTERHIKFINIKENDGVVEIEINGNSFLLNMVRIIVGTLVEVGQGIKNPKEIKSILEGLNRELAGHKAPAKGLVLKEIEY